MTERSTTTIDERVTRVESLIESQQETIQEQQETIEYQQNRMVEQAETIESLRNDLDAATTVGTGGGGMSRRSALMAGGVLGLLGIGAGTTSASASGQIGTEGRPLGALYTDELDGGIVDRSTPITSLAGNTSVSSSAPGGAEEGDLWVDPSGRELCVHDGSDWQSVPPEPPSLYAEADDLSDIEMYQDSTDTGGGSSNVTLVSVTGEGYLLGGIVEGYYPRTISTSENYRVDIVVDGVTNQVPADRAWANTAAGGNYPAIVLPPIHFDDSLEIQYTSVQYRVTGVAYIKFA